MSSSGMDNLAEHAARFFRWWGKELLMLIPPSVTQRFSVSQEVVSVVVSSTGETQPPLESFTDGQLIVLSLDASVVLSHNIRLPFANHRATEGMANIQMSRIMPLPMEDLYSDWRSAGPIENLRDGASQQKVLLYVAKRKVLGPVFETIQSKGFLLADILIEGVAGFSTLAPTSVRRGLNHRTLRSVGLGVTALLLILMLPYAWMLNIRSENEIVSRELSALQDMIADVSELRNHLDGHNAQVKFLVAERSNDRFSEALSLLSAESPDSVFLRDFSYERNTVRVAGYAASSAEWALALGKQPSVGNVNLQRVSSGRSPDDPENFDIVIDLVNGPGR